MVSNTGGGDGGKGGGGGGDAGGGRKRVVEVKAVAVVGMAERLVPVETAVAGKEEVVEGTWVEAAVAAVRATAARAMAAEMETR